MPTTSGSSLKGASAAGSQQEAGDAEIVMFLNRNQDHIPIEVPALSTEQALQTVPRRLSLSNPTAEVAALSAGEAESAGEASVGAAEDEDAGEAGSGGKEGVSAGCGDSAGEGSLGLETLGMNGE